MINVARQRANAQIIIVSNQLTRSINIGCQCFLFDYLIIFAQRLVVFTKPITADYFVCKNHLKSRQSCLANVSFHSSRVMLKGGAY